MKFPKAKVLHFFIPINDTNNDITGYYSLFIIIVLFSLINAEHFASKFEVNYSVEKISTSKIEVIFEVIYSFNRKF